MAKHQSCYVTCYLTYNVAKHQSCYVTCYLTYNVAKHQSCYVTCYLAYNVAKHSHVMLLVIWLITWQHTSHVMLNVCYCKLLTRFDGAWTLNSRITINPCDYEKAEDPSIYCGVKVVYTFKRWFG